MPFAFRISLDSFHGIENSIARINARLIRICIRRNKRAQAALELATSRSYRPRLQVFARVLFVVLKRMNSDNLIVFDINFGNIRTYAKRVHACTLDDCFFCTDRFFLYIFSKHAGIRLGADLSPGDIFRRIATKLIHDNAFGIARV